MPGWLVSLLQIFAPMVIKWALAFLEKKYPGISQQLQKILDYLDGHPDQEIAVKNVGVCVSGLCQKK